MHCEWLHFLTEKPRQPLAFKYKDKADVLTFKKLKQSEKNEDLAIVERTANAKDLKGWKVDLRIRNQNQDPKQFPYNFTIETSGIFEISDYIPIESRERIVAANAPALLYDASREILAMVTSRGPYSQVVLPTVTFIDEAQPRGGDKPASPTPKPVPADHAPKR